MAGTKQKGNKTQARKSTAGMAPGKPVPAKAARKSTQVSRSNTSQGHGLQRKATGNGITLESVAGKVLDTPHIPGVSRNRGRHKIRRGTSPPGPGIVSRTLALLSAPLEALKLSVCTYLQDFKQCLVCICAARGGGTGPRSTGRCC